VSGLSLQLPTTDEIEQMQYKLTGPVVSFKLPPKNLTKRRGRPKKNQNKRMMSGLEKSLLEAGSANMKGKTKIPRGALADVPKNSKLNAEIAERNKVRLMNPATLRVLFSAVHSGGSNNKAQSHCFLTRTNFVLLVQEESALIGPVSLVFEKGMRRPIVIDLTIDAESKAVANISSVNKQTFPNILKQHELADFWAAQKWSLQGKNSFGRESFYLGDLLRNLTVLFPPQLFE